MNPDSPRVSKHPRVSVKLVKTLSSTVINKQETPQKIPDKPADEEEKKGKEIDPTALGLDGALQYYAKAGDLEAMRKAYQEGANINVAERGPVDLEGTPESNHTITGDYPLHMAAGGGHKAAVNELLNWEADIEAKNRVGSTPLHRAVSHDQLEIVKKLLKEGALVGTTNKIGNTALHCAAFIGSVDMAKLLIEAHGSANINQGNMYGATPVMLAARSSATLLKYLLSLRPGRIGYSTDTKETKRLSIPKKESTEKRSSVTGEKRLSFSKPSNLDVVDTTVDLASPSEQRTIAAPSIVGATEIELTSPTPSSPPAYSDTDNS